MLTKIACARSGSRIGPSDNLSSLYPIESLQKVSQTGQREGEELPRRSSSASSLPASGNISYSDILNLVVLFEEVINNLLTVGHVYILQRSDIALTNAQPVVAPSCVPVRHHVSSVGASTALSPASLAAYTPAPTTIAGDLTDARPQVIRTNIYRCWVTIINMLKS